MNDNDSYLTKMLVLGRQERDLRPASGAVTVTDHYCWPVR